MLGNLKICQLRFFFENIFFYKHFKIHVFRKIIFGRRKTFLEQKECNARRTCIPVHAPLAVGHSGTVSGGPGCRRSCFFVFSKTHEYFRLKSRDISAQLQLGTHVAFISGVYGQYWNLSATPSSGSSSPRFDLISPNMQIVRIPQAGVL